MWSLYENNKFLNPLVFSNNKSQEDIVREVSDAIEKGYRIIFIRGMCGTGKSAIALNLCKKFGKTSIVVPIKSLQEQYINDYTNKKYILSNNKKLKIFSIAGRQNFKCRFIEEGNFSEKTTKKETNAKLFDVYKKPKKDINKTCDNIHLPCKIELKEKNLEIIKDYIKKNPNVSITDFQSIKDVKRMSIAPTCPYWSPIFPEEINLRLDSNKIKYKAMNNRNFIFHQREKGCPYYEQYFAYAEADAIIFNSLKYKLEVLMNRKPETELEIIDECDEFLDSFANIEHINLDRLLFALNTIFIQPKVKKLIDELKTITNKIRKYTISDKILNIKETPVEDLLMKILVNKDLLDEIESDEYSYLYHLEKVARIFEYFLDETFFSISKKDNDLILNLVTTNLEKRFQESVDKNKVLVMMSGTVHSKNVLKKIFGLKEFKIINAETQYPGELVKCKYGHEIDCKYMNFKNKIVTREVYLRSLEKTIESAKKPVLIHVTSFSDLPTEQEKNKFNLNLPTQFELIKEQNDDPFGRRVEDFKNKKTEILFTTKCSRGMDFPGNTCNSIILTRFPYPNISSIFWKILKETNPEGFMDFYMDKAERELLQRVYRGLRSENDKLYLLSPDIRVLDFEF
ncbi:hypothetical protein GF386_04715 [Candidatus Pacearchaeota archaeon]|nr:hypothetical protein [Candidatus Pacearchaeota archaeon]MBD3283419.1 hypothetical protein [Candidatus Pacearchaeota archaeon]